MCQAVGGVRNLFRLQVDNRHDKSVRLRRKVKLHKGFTLSKHLNLDVEELDRQEWKRGDL